MKELAAIILAAGKGTRLVSEKPKVLHLLAGKPLLYYSLKLVWEVGANPCYVVVGYEADKVKEAFKNESVYWVDQGEQRGTGHALSVTASMLSDFDGDLLVLYGDTPVLTVNTLRELIKVHQQSPDTTATLLSFRMANPTGYGRIIRDEHNKVIRIVEENDATGEEKKITEINAGVYLFNPASIFNALKKIKPNSRDGEYQLTDTILFLAKKGERVQGYCSPDPEACPGINSREELVAVQRLMQQRIQEDLLKAGVTIIDPANTYIETDVVIGPDTTIYPFTVIRTGVKIGRHCEVGPFSHLRTGTVLEDYAEVGNFTEAKQTKLGRHSKAKHLSYLGDAVIGDDVNIGAGTITANFDGKNKYQTIIEDGASTGSGTILIAPMKLGKEAVTGAGAVVPKGTKVPDGTTVVGIPARPLKKKSSR